MLERKFYIPTGVAGNTLADYLIAIMHDARATTFRYIRDISQDELDWQPYPGWNTIGALLSHIIAGDYFFKIYFIERRELTEEEKKLWIPGLELGEYVQELKGKSPSYYSEELMKSHHEIRDAVKSISAEDLLNRRYDAYDKENGCDLAWILYHNAEDEVHHRGQISLLRKLYKRTQEQTP